MSPRARWLTAAAALFLGFVFLHWPVTLFCERLIRQFGFEGYQHRMAAGFLIVGAAAAGALLFRRATAPSVTWPALLALFVVAAVFQKYLILINVEQIHLVQYALLTMLLAQGGLDAETAWLWTTALGVVDEMYQFRILRVGTPDYLDWNDITFNALGASFGIIILLHLGAVRIRRRQMAWRPLLVGCMAIGAIALFLAPPVFVPFYTVTPAGLRNHILSAGEGIVLVMLLFGLIRLVEERVTLSPYDRIAGREAEALRH